MNSDFFKFHSRKVKHNLEINFCKPCFFFTTPLYFSCPLLTSLPMASTQGQCSSLEPEAQHVVLTSLSPQTTSEPRSLSPGGSRQSQQLAAKSPPTQIRAQSLNTGSFPGTDNERRADRKERGSSLNEHRAER